MDAWMHGGYGWSRTDCWRDLSMYAHTQKTIRCTLSSRPANKDATACKFICSMPGPHARMNYGQRVKAGELQCWPRGRWAGPNNAAATFFLAERLLSYKNWNPPACVPCPRHARTNVKSPLSRSPHNPDPLQHINPRPPAARTAPTPLAPPPPPPPPAPPPRRPPRPPPPQPNPPPRTSRAPSNCPDSAHSRLAYVFAPKERFPTRPSPRAAIISQYAEPQQCAPL